MIRLLLAFAVLVGSFAAQAAPKRPKQFVLLAFDGSKNNTFWQESRKFAADNDLKYTYFVNGVYFLFDNDHAKYYKDLADASKAGTSAIGWGGTDLGVMKTRLNHVRDAMIEGHEMASHGNAHFDGSGYSLKQWSSDFEQFATIMANSWKRFDPKNEPQGWTEYWTTEVVGFRAPQLGRNDNLWTALVNFNYEYDTSNIDKTNYWPRDDKGFWNFPLGSVNIIDQNGKPVYKKNKKGETVPATTLSMDYNFYVYDSKGVDDAANATKYKKQMYNTYMNYFNSNYYGNRAPVQIGHHFSKWNGGAYWEAMKQFSEAVCGMEEVVCGTYKELVEFMNANKANIASFQKGEFSDGKLKTPGLLPMNFGPLASDEDLEELRAQRNDHFNAHDEE